MIFFYRAFDLTNVGDKEVYDVDGVQFIGDERTFDNGVKYAENSCYCKNNQCSLPSGVRNVTACLQAPVFISFPHFYLADASYRQDVSGMSPDAAKHQFSFTMQKVSNENFQLLIGKLILVEFIRDFHFRTRESLWTLLLDYK